MPKVETSMYVENLKDGPYGQWKDHARLMLIITIDGEKYREDVITSGPREDIEDYYDGKITMQELRKRWNFSR